jgi:Leucine-rich repeat (LRR) protein
VNIEPLQSLMQLTDLEISGVNFGTTFTLTLPQLTSLKIRAGILNEIFSLPSLVPKLNTLELSYTKVADLSAVSRFVELQSLTVRGNRFVTDASFVSALPN